MAEQPCLAGSAIRAQTAEDVCSDEALRSGHNHTDSLCVSSIGLLCTSLPPPRLSLSLPLSASLNGCSDQSRRPAGARPCTKPVVPGTLWTQPQRFLPNQPDSISGPDGEISNPPLSWLGASFQVFDRFNSGPWLPHLDHFQVSTVKLFRQDFTQTI